MKYAGHKHEKIIWIETVFQVSETIHASCS